MISPYFGGSSLYFANFLENLPTKIFRISYISYVSPYLKFQISLTKFKNSLLCLIILPIWKRKSPYLSSGMYHMSENCEWCNLNLFEVNTGVHTKTAPAVQYSFKLNRVICHKFYHCFKIKLSILINIHLSTWFSLFQRCQI